MVLRPACGGKIFYKGPAWAMGGTENAFAHVHSQNDRFYEGFEHASIEEAPGHPVDAPASQPASQPAPAHPLDGLASQPASQSAPCTPSGWTGQPVNQPASQPASQLPLWTPWHIQLQNAG